MAFKKKLKPAVCECGYEYMPNALFCKKCGKALGAENTDSKNNPKNSKDKTATMKIQSGVMAKGNGNGTETNTNIKTNGKKRKSDTQTNLKTADVKKKSDTQTNLKTADLKKKSHTQTNLKIADVKEKSAAVKSDNGKEAAGGLSAGKDVKINPAKVDGTGKIGETAVPEKAKKDKKEKTVTDEKYRISVKFTVQPEDGTAEAFAENLPERDLLPPQTPVSRKLLI